MGGTRKDGEVARAKSAMKEALGTIVGDEDIRAEGVAGHPNGKGKAATAPAEGPSRRPPAK